MGKKGKLFLTRLVERLVSNDLRLYILRGKEEIRADLACIRSTCIRQI